MTHAPSNVVEMFKAVQTTQVLPTNTSIGRNQEGGWKTTHLKAYPIAFCGALAEVIRVFLSDGAIEKLCVLMSSVHTMGPNFHPATGA